MSDASLPSFLRAWSDREPAEKPEPFRTPDCLDLGLVVDAAEGRVELTEAQRRHVDQCSRRCGKVFLRTRSLAEEEDSFWEPELQLPGDEPTLTLEDDQAIGSSGIIPIRLQQIVEERTAPKPAMEIPTPETIPSKAERV